MTTSHTPADVQAAIDRLKFALIDYEHAYSVRLPPNDVICLIAEVTALRERLEIDPRHAYDGIYRAAMKLFISRTRR
jgi:hypothetical protein